MNRQERQERSATPPFLALWRPWRFRCLARRPWCDVGCAQRQELCARGNVRCSLGNAPCSLGNAPCSLGKAPCSLGKAPCSLCKVPCSSGKAPCSLGKVPCSLGKAPCARRNGPCTQRTAPCARRTIPCAPATLLGARRRSRSRHGPPCEGELMHGGCPGDERQDPPGERATHPGLGRSIRLSPVRSPHWPWRRGDGRPPSRRS